MVDMHLGIRLHLRDNLIHQPFEAFLLFFTIQCPSFFIEHFAAGISEREAEKILQPRFADVRISLPDLADFSGEGSGNVQNPLPPLAAKVRTLTYFPLAPAPERAPAPACARSQTCSGLSLRGSGKTANFSILSVSHSSNWLRCCRRIPATHDK